MPKLSSRVSITLSRMGLSTLFIASSSSEVTVVSKLSSEGIDSPRGLPSKGLYMWTLIPLRVLLKLSIILLVLYWC